MRSTRIGLVAAAAVLGLGLSACGSDSGDGGSDGGSGDDGGSSDTIKIGIKFDQPGLGLKQGNDYTGFDVDVATYVAEQLGYSADAIEWVQAPSAQRETLIQTDQVKLVVATYSITEERAQKITFAGPYFIAGQDLLVSVDSDITGPDSLDGKKLCSVTGSTSAQKVQEQVPGVNLQEFGTYSECVAALSSGTIDAVTTDDTILAGYASQEQYAGKLKVVGQTFSEENYGIGLKLGDTELCQQVTDAIQKMIDDGEWQTFVDDNLGAAGYTPPPGNPPTPEPCS